MRIVTIALTALLFAVPAHAQQGHQHHDMHRGGSFPEGWSARTDRGQPLDDVVFMRMGDGFHATTGPAAVFYNPAWSHRGDYAVSARFTQRTSPEHPEAYGLILGGAGLEGDDQAYSYFLVRKTGEYFIATRDGDERTVVEGWTAHDAVRPEGENGRQTNVLGAQVRGDQVVFTVNGTEVARHSRDRIRTDGMVGFRINHRLDVHIDQIRR